ncbi:hypothetical protein GCM10027599_10980 [Yimella radicis]
MLGKAVTGPLGYFSPVNYLEDAGGQLWLPSKSISALERMARHLGEGIHVIASKTQTRDDRTPDGYGRVTADNGIVPRAFSSETLHRDVAGAARGLALLTALHRPAYEWLLRTDVPVVYTSENPLTTRLDQARASAANRIDGGRRAMGELRRERCYVRMARRAKGLECNGIAAASAYGRYNTNVLVYNDSRIADYDLTLARGSRMPEPGQPLRVAFSGRWTAIKGTTDVLRVAERCQYEGIDARFYIAGGGDLADQINSVRVANVTVIGYLDFETDWKPWVRNQVDVMLLPHRQGDPSGTYFEALGCGAPILGYTTEILEQIVAAGAGWSVRRNDPAALTDTIAMLTRERGRIAAARVQGLEFMASRTLEAVTAQKAAFYSSIRR